jgi:hypothetical protein
MKDMALRQSAVRTLACLTANRANGQNCTRPITAAGKARVALKALQHGGRTDPAGAGRSSSRAGDREGEALFFSFLGKRVPLVPRGNYRHLWDGQGRCEERRAWCRTVPGRADSKRRPRRGAGRETWCGYEQSRNVL